MESFITSTLSTDGTKSFFDPIKRNKLVTFDEMKKQTKIGIGKGQTKLVLISADLVFRRALT